MTEGSYPRTDLVGRTFGKLIVKAFAGRIPNTGKVRWLCQCSCGNQILSEGSNLKSGNTQSCGCFKIQRTKEINSTHRESRTYLYRIYAGILERCLNVKNPAYPRYGGRGIKIAEEWLGGGGYEKFRDHVGHRPSSLHSIDRKDNDGNYAPGNVRWSTPSEQSRNTRKTLKVSYGGEILSLIELCERKNLPYATIFYRVKAGWSTNDAIERPIRDCGR